MTSKEEVRQVLGSARAFYNIRLPYEQAAKSLRRGGERKRLSRENKRLKACETAARRKIKRILSNVDLSPRRLTVLQMHYLEYQSWKAISEKLNIERRYALQLHSQAIESIARQICVKRVETPKRPSGAPKSGLRRGLAAIPPGFVKTGYLNADRPQGAEVVKNMAVGVGLNPLDTHIQTGGAVGNLPHNPNLVLPTE